MLEKNLHGAREPEFRERLDLHNSMISMRRIGEPVEMADAVLWLSSPRSSYVTGQVITVDGALGV